MRGKIIVLKLVEAPSVQDLVGFHSLCPRCNRQSPVLYMAKNAFRFAEEKSAEGRLTVTCHNCNYAYTPKFCEEENILN